MRISCSNAMCRSGLARRMKPTPQDGIVKRSITSMGRKPDPIRAHLLELLAKKRRSERTRYTANRNLWLALAVERMRDLGFDPTRSTFTKPAKGEKQSGSKIVRTVLAQHFGINLSERTIEDAWTDYKARLPFRAHPLRKK